MRAKNESQQDGIVLAQVHLQSPPTPAVVPTGSWQPLV